MGVSRWPLAIGREVGNARRGVASTSRIYCVAVVGVAAAFAALGAGQTWPSRHVLLAVPGIGPWTVDYFALRALRDPDVLLTSDLAVRRVLRQCGLTGTPKQLAQVLRGIDIVLGR